MKKIVSLYSGSDGESHFKEIEILLEKKDLRWVTESKPTKVSEVSFREFQYGNVIVKNSTPGWHAAPFRQLIVVLEGKMTIEVGDGSKRSFKPGDMLLAEDTTGHGHVTYQSSRANLVIPLGNEKLL